MNEYDALYQIDASQEEGLLLMCLNSGDVQRIKFALHIAARTYEENERNMARDGIGTAEDLEKERKMLYSLYDIVAAWVKPVETDDKEDWDRQQYVSKAVMNAAEKIEPGDMFLIAQVLRQEVRDLDEEIVETGDQDNMKRAALLMYRDRVLWLANTIWDSLGEHMDLILKKGDGE